MMRAISFLLICFLMMPIPGARAVDAQKKAIVLGIDGMDPVLLKTYMDEGRMPNFKKLSDGSGGFKKLITSYPPQSPVAWSNVAVGGNPGRHGIFDFVHRDPKTLKPYLSITRTKAPEKFFKMGSWQIPLSAGSIENLRKGKSYWEHLCEKDVSATICQIPANYPPTCSCESDRLKLLSGMGTPDLLGTQGTFSFYTSEEMNLHDVIGGGEIYQVAYENGEVSGVIYGPAHPYKNPEAFEDKKDLALQIPFTVWADAENKTAQLEINGNTVLLREGEFSEWVQVKFDVIPFVQSITSIVRFHLKETSPHFKLYVSPLNIDPSNPAVPISQPNDFAKELQSAVGNFYTVNMPPDTKALEHGILDDDEFLKQHRIVFEEEEARLWHELGEFKDGVLFHYFSVLDQLCHTFWRHLDPEHPQYTEANGKKYGSVIPNLYVSFDRILGRVMEQIDSDTLLMVMSDHGFAPFRRGVNLNTILLNNGFLKIKNPAKQASARYFSNVNWKDTKAYNVGINSVYINLYGRDKYGSVYEKDYDKVVADIKKTLLNFVDEETGLKPIKNVSTRDEIYTGPYVEQAPDLIIGYDYGYRASWDTILGGMPKAEVEDNTSPWSGDHTIYFDLVPGVLLANRKIDQAEPALIDLAPTILDYFGVKEHGDMEGKSVFNS